MKNVSDIYPLTPVQAGMLFHTLQAPGSGVYFEQYVCTLNGSLDLACFRQAWQTALERHAVLRTAFIWEGLDEPLQVVRQTLELPFAHVDWRELSETEQRERLEAYIQTDRTRGFDPAKAPLLRLSLFQTAPAVHQFVWSFHHLQLDGWSTGLLLEEVFDSYEALRRGDPPRHSPPRAFKYFVGWLKQQDLNQAEHFWKNELAGFTTPTALSVDKAAAAQKTRGRYRQKQTKLSASATATLHQLAQQHRLTLNTIFQGAWAILLSRYSSEGDVLFGTTVSGRPADLPGVESMIGMFINTLPTRVQVYPDSEVLPWLKQIQSRQLALRRFEYSPLAEIQSWSDIPKGRALFDTIVVFENYPVDGSTFQNGHSSLHVNHVRYLEQSNYPLSVLVQPGNQLQLCIIYNTSYFEDEVIDRLLGHLKTILAGIVANTMNPIKTIEMLTTAERQQVLQTWNKPHGDLPRPQQTQHFFEQHATQNPDTLAVVDNAGRLTYGELDRKANQLAHYLRSLGVGPNTAVGLALERSSKMIVAILGVLKAGGAYLPLDPDYPSERLNFMLSDTQAPVVLTQKKLADALPDHNAQTVCIDSEWDAITLEDSRAPRIAAQPDNLAYVIYTSGSTGKPKGVPISHRNLVHSTSARFEFYEKKVNRFLLLSSFSFDSSVVGIFWTLCQGGTLVLPPQGTEQDIPKLVATIASYKISHLLVLPSLYAILLEQPDARKLTSLNTVIVAGEECRRGLVDLHYTRLPRATLFNEYGPTECTVWSTAYKIPTRIEGDCVPIGRPIPNTQNYILDCHDQLAPIGIPGELCIGGAGVTAGYLNQPELSAQKFTACDNAGQPPPYLYRTGDLARYLADGNIAFLGRMDHQVKIRGYRIELGEIESTLDQHSAIQDVVVVTRDDQIDNKSITAYVVLKPNTAATIDELQVFIRKKLPAYMAPSNIVFLDRLPVTPSGKVDRKSLPAPNQLKTRIDENYVAATDSLETQLVRLWEKVLSVQPISTTDNFFSLGGQSLLALKVLYHIRKLTGKDIPLAALFEAPTVSQLADTIRRDGWKSPFSLLIPYQPLGTKPPFFCIHGGAVGVADKIGLEQPFYSGMPHGFDGKRFSPSVTDMVSDYIREIRLLQPQGPYFIGGYSFGGLIAFEMACKLFEEGHEIGTLVMIEPTSIGVLPAQQKNTTAQPTANTKSESTIEYTARVFKTLKALETREKVKYFFSRIWVKAVKRSGIERKVKLLVIKFCTSAGILVPQNLNRFYRDHMFNKAAKNYTPNIFPGDAILFRATQSKINPILSWQEFIAGKIEVHTLACDHLDIVKAPHDGLLAEKLKRVLLCAQDNLKYRN